MARSNLARSALLSAAVAALVAGPGPAGKNVCAVAARRQYWHRPVRQTVGERLQRRSRDARLVHSLRRRLQRFIHRSAARRKRGLVQSISLPEF